MINLDASVADGAGALVLPDRDRTASRRTENRRQYTSKFSRGPENRIAPAVVSRQ